MSNETGVCGICAQSIRLIDATSNLTPTIPTWIMVDHFARPGVHCGGSLLTVEESYDNAKVRARWGEPFDPTVLPEGWTRHPAPNYEFRDTYRYTSRPLTMAYLPSGKLEVVRWVQRPHGEEYEWETEEPEGSDLVLAGVRWRP